MRQLLGAVLFLLFSGVAQSADDMQLQRLESALDAVRQEQQSVFQQFQMAESLQRSEMQSIETGPPSVYVPDGQAPSYNDAVRAKQERQERLQYYSEELRRLSARYRQLDGQSQSLVEQIRALAQPAR